MGVWQFWRTPGCRHASLHDIASPISGDMQKPTIVLALSFLNWLEWMTVVSVEQELLQWHPAAEYSPFINAEGQLEHDRHIKKRNKKKNSDKLSCTHFLWKACWHGNTPSSSFTLKSSRHTAHVCCVTDRAERGRCPHQWYGPALSQCLCFAEALAARKTLFKCWFLPHEDLIFWDLPLKQPVGNTKRKKNSLCWVITYYLVLESIVLSVTSLYPKRSLWAWWRSLLWMKRETQLLRSQSEWTMFYILSVWIDL